MASDKIRSPEDAALGDLCAELARLAPATDRSGDWPGRQLELCGEAGVFEWFLPQERGGLGWDDEAVTRGYLALSRACLATTFIITQRTGACRRIASGENDDLKQRLLPRLLTGESFATVGISHLTTSRRHLSKPALTAERTADGWRLDGIAPWVTGGVAAETIVVGAVVMESGEATTQELLIAASANAQGVSVPPPFEMAALSASKTGAVRFDEALLSDEAVIAGPTEKVLQVGVGGGTGGPQTSTLALGAAAASIQLLADESAKRPDLKPAHEALVAEHNDLLADLLAAARGEPNCPNESLRQRANSCVLRASQAALTAVKGAGFLADAAASRRCREALFFLVWSCPQPVQNANLCELAGIAE